MRLRGIRLGHTVDLILDPGRTRVLGFDVLCGDDARRFLPFPAASIAGDGLEISSVLTLLEADERDYYQRHGRSFAGDDELRDALVSEDGAFSAAAAAE